MSDQSLQNKCVKLEDFIDYYDDAIKYSDFKYNTTNMLKEEEKKGLKNGLSQKKYVDIPKIRIVLHYQIHTHMESLVT
jgi:hypothetical protein